MVKWSRSHSSRAVKLPNNRQNLSQSCDYIAYGSIHPLTHHILINAHSPPLSQKHRFHYCQKKSSGLLKVLQTVQQSHNHVYLPSTLHSKLPVKGQRSNGFGIRARMRRRVKHGREAGWHEERGAAEPGEDCSNLPATSAGTAIHSQQDIGTGGREEGTQVMKS